LSFFDPSRLGGFGAKVDASVRMKGANRQLLDSPFKKRGEAALRQKLQQTGGS
jgi:hypothetical protein